MSPMKNFIYKMKIIIFEFYIFISISVSLCAGRSAHCVVSLVRDSKLKGILIRVCILFAFVSLSQVLTFTVL